jgi:arylsulfatase A-like enzyme
VGQVVRRLKQIGEYDDTMIVVTADHGVAFTAGDRSRGVTSSNYPQIMWTPLFVKLPDQTEGKVDDRAAETIDILPTIADELGIDLPWKVDGRSLLGAPRPDGPRRLADWALNGVRPQDGRSYVEFDGPSGFATLMRSRANGSTGDPALRLYRFGDYGALVGRPAAPLVAPGRRRIEATLENAADYHDVRKDAPRIPWAYAQGVVARPAGAWVAVTVDGVIAGVSQTVRGDADQSEYAAVIAPELVRNGRNEIDLFLVAGTPDAPRLLPIRLRR